MGNKGNSFISYKTGFSPTDITGLYIWYDMSDITTITKDGSNLVEKILNKEGTTVRDVVQATSGDKPTWVSANKNSLDVVDFVGASSMKCASILTAITQPFTYFSVMLMPVAGATDYISIDGQTVGQPRMRFFNKINTGTDNYSAGDGTDISFTDATIDATWQLVTTVVNGASSSIRINQVSKVSGTIGASNYAGVTLGANSGVTTFWNNKMGEVILYDALLDATQIADVEDYLKTKWAV